MAYDQGSAYEAPRRAYYDQHQQAPVRRQNGGYPTPQQYDNYDQHYDQGYGQPQQQYGGHDDYGYGVDQQSAQYYDNNNTGNGYGYGYEQQDQRGYPVQEQGPQEYRQDYRQDGYAQQPNGYGRPNDGYANGHHEDYNSQGRQYDPRYQQRPGRGGHPPPNGSRMQRPPPPGNGDYRGQPPQRPRQDPRNGQPQERSGYPNQGPPRHEQQQNGYGHRPDVRDLPAKRPSPPQANGGPRQAPPPAEEQKKSAMEEWKAKERARMHEAASKPKIIPQDNAFPTFAGNKKDGDRSNARDAKGARSSEEHGRPSTSGGRHEPRQGSSRSNNQQRTSPPSTSNGQSHPNRAPQPYAPIHEQPVQDYAPQYAQGNGDYGYDRPAQQPPQVDRHAKQPEGYPRQPPPMQSNPESRSYNELVPQSRSRPPPQAHPAGVQDRGPQRMMSPPVQNNATQQPPQPVVSPTVEPIRSNPPEPQPEPVVQSDEYYPQESWRTGPPRKRPQAERQQTTEPAKPQEPWRTGPTHEQPQEPQVKAPPPEAAPQLIRQQTMPNPQTIPLAHQAPERSFSPVSQPSRSGTPRAQAQAPNFARPNIAPAASVGGSSLDDVLDDYYTTEETEYASNSAPPKNREEEIEAEMPDFDSAAPGQTSSLHKRVQPEAAAPVPSMPSQHVNPSVQSLPVQGNQPYAYHQEPAIASQPELRDVRQDQNGGSDGFVFGVPGEQFRPQQQYEESPQMQTRQQPMAYRPAQSVPPENMRRFQSPVNQRQMQMPMRGGPPGEHPPGQRFHPGGHGPLPPGPRSASTRPPMNQGGWSDPSMNRAPTAPPMRQDPHGAPHHGMPRTGSLTNQQHQHRAPSAPPGQQNMRGMPPPGSMAPPGVPRNGSLTQGSRPPPQEQRRSDPDALPHHPTPFRPGLMEQGATQPPKPAPVRNYDNRSSTTSGHSRTFSISDKPITKADLEQARLDHEASKASPRLALRYAKKLVEASHVLASEGGRLDAKTTQRNREKYLNEAYKRIKDLVRNAYPEAQFYMAECYGSGELGLQIDPKEAFGLYQAAAKGGHAAAAFRTAVSCEIGPEDGGGTRKDYPKAVQWYRRAAALGDGAAMFKLGIILLRGLLGVPRNVGEALIWLKRAAERADKDNPHALHELATLHEPTNGDPQVREKVVPDEAYSLSLYKQAAEFGFKRSQFRLGQAYEYGSLGLEIDNRASIAWYTKAAAQGEHNAELALSGWYLTGAEGMLEQSDMEAYLWARKAAQSEPPLAKAMFAMGYFTEQGIGCPKSLEEAKRWYGRAASFQFPRALERLEELKKGGKNKAMAGKLTRDKKKDEENCAVM